MGRYYSLLTAIGKYGEGEDLPSYEMDLKLIKNALINGLGIPSENIRSFEENGYVKVKSLARTLREFMGLLDEDDGFIFYFSGHGRDGYLFFSDGEISIQDFVDYMEKLNAKTKIIILDCCYSGRFSVKGTKQMDMEATVNAFAGTGTAVLASSTSDESSWLGPGRNHSLYTGMLTTAMTVKRKVRKGKISLAEINESVLSIAGEWNKKNPHKIQHPIYRANTGGTIYFEVEEYNPYKTLQVYLETKKYIIKNVEPLSSLTEKRLAVFVLVRDKCDEKIIAKITREAAAYIKNANVFSTEASEAKFRNMPAEAIWCYFGYDESDMVNHRYFARSIWCNDRYGRKKYFIKQKNVSVRRNIWISFDPFYEAVRKLQQSDISKEEFQYRTKKLLTKTVSMAEKFISDIREIDNQTRTVGEIKRIYSSWIREVYEEYYKMTEIPTAPDELHDWFKAVEDLSGCVLDMAILLNKDAEYSETNRWLMQNSIRRYNETLEILKALENNIAFNV